jgi:hypothetical protein
MASKSRVDEAVEDIDREISVLTAAKERLLATKRQPRARTRRVTPVADNGLREEDLPLPGLADEQPEAD